MKASILTIGDELLIGQTIDTNSVWLSKELGLAGFEIIYKSTIPDRADAIMQALHDATNRSNLIVITGGLGPTKDDITKHTLSTFYQCGLTHRPAVETWVREIFSTRNMPMPDSNLLQAMIPEVAEVLWNRAGTAPGMWFDQNNVVLISMPGVPHEMKTIFSEEALPKIKSRFVLPHIEHRIIQTASIGESRLAVLIRSVEDTLPEHIRLAYLPSLGGVTLRFSGISNQPQQLEIELNEIENAVRSILGNSVVGIGHYGVLETICAMMIEKNLSIATAESCTGGYLAHRLTSIPGSSAYFQGSVVAYDNDVKKNLLQVPDTILKEHGAVSQWCAEEMAKNICALMKTDIGIATTGIAGPGGGTLEKPVGLVWIAIQINGVVSSSSFQFKDERDRFVIRTSQMAFDMLRRRLIEINN